MLDRITVGRIPAKPHTALRDEAGRLMYEECLTRDGFDGPFTILYHQNRPHLAEIVPALAVEDAAAARIAPGWAAPQAAADARTRPLARRHYRTPELLRAFDVTSEPAVNGAPLIGRTPLLFNDDVVISTVVASISDSVYFANGDADELLFVFSGGGTLISPFGALPFEKHDYLVVPRGVLHRFVLPEGGGPQLWLSVECLGGLSLPRQFRNDVGQLRMDAPYSHRDFRRPGFSGPRDEGHRDLLVKRGDRFHGFRYPHSPLDVVGWDGSVYPFAFPISAFQPRVAQVHLPPTWHGTFAARGALICSFVPRPLDFHPDAIPCPYPHSSVSCDEVLFYCDGNFTSRRGVGPGSLSHHPAGIPHGPHPGAYEGSIGAKWTDELAVMLDTTRPLTPTTAAAAIEDPSYHASFG